jgi:nicotinamidase-related amidase/type 1 glutamine amidotransferase
LLLATAACACATPVAANDEESGTLVLRARRRVETRPQSGRYHTLTETARWEAGKTAVVICDMWNQHWCKSATRRVGEMAARMNKLVAALRAKGVLIIHCPSDTLEAYAQTAQRRLAMAAPSVATARPIERWCHLDESVEGKLPIDDSDGGCDCTPQCRNFKAWSSQIAQIEIAPQDAITDSAEAFYLMRQRGITNVLVMGVHTNMCVLGRPFSIRQMIYQGQNVLLVRDMTDTMYNPRKAPFVHHCTGTDLVIEHIEKHWCPTVTSADILGGEEFRFSEDNRPHVAFLVAEDEYKTEQSLPRFAAEELGKSYRTSFIFSREENLHDLPGLEALDSADLLFVSVRRRVPPKDQLARIRRFVAAGKPVVAIRTASHAFSLRGETPPPDGHEAWTTFDAEVLGGNYTGHHGAGPEVAIRPAAGAGAHALLAGVDLEHLAGFGSLYKVSPLAATTSILLEGSIPGQPAEPVAWTNTNRYQGRVFYTSLGHVDDFKQPAFRALLVNAVRWALEREPKRESP